MFLVFARLNCIQHPLTLIIYVKNITLYILNFLKEFIHLNNFSKTLNTFPYSFQNETYASRS